MSLAERFRWLGDYFPTWGRCGGSKLSCTPIKTKDPMDEAFRVHDMNFYLADKLDPKACKAARENADFQLYKTLQKINPKTLSLYGKIFRFCSLLVFK